MNKSMSRKKFSVNFCTFYFFFRDMVLIPAGTEDTDSGPRTDGEGWNNVSLLKTKKGTRGIGKGVVGPRGGVK